MCHMGAMGFPAMGFPGMMGGGMMPQPMQGGGMMMPQPMQGGVMPQPGMGGMMMSGGMAPHFALADGNQNPASVYNTGEDADITKSATYLAKIPKMRLQQLTEAISSKLPGDPFSSVLTSGLGALSCLLYTSPSPRD